MALWPKSIQAPMPPPNPTTPTPSPSPQPTATPQPITQLIFGGDIMLGRTVDSRIEQFGGNWPLEKLASILSASDITVANLESPFRSDAPRTQINSLVLRGNPKGILSLIEAGIDVVSLANNHITDMGSSGLAETKQLLSDNQIAFTGAGTDKLEAAQPAIITRNGLRFGFLSYTYGVNVDSTGVFYNQTNIEQLRQDIANLKPKADIITLLAHFGSEYHVKENNEQEAFAHAAIDAGATLVVGAHPHIAQPIERYKDGLILYSLGNLVFDQLPGEGRDISALASLRFEGTTLKNIELLPYKIYNYGQPALVTDAKTRQEILSRFNLPEGSLSF